MEEWICVGFRCCKVNCNAIGLVLILGVVRRVVLLSHRDFGSASQLFKFNYLLLLLLFRCGGTGATLHLVCGCPALVSSQNFVAFERSVFILLIVALLAGFNAAIDLCVNQHLMFVCLLSYNLQRNCCGRGCVMKSYYIHFP